MADNVPITAGTGTTVATDDIGGVHYQRTKTTVGADGSIVGDVSGRTIDGGAGAAMFVDQRSKLTRISVTPTISTSVYAAKDAVGGRMDFANAARAAGGSITVVRAQIVDLDQERADLDLVLFDRSFTAPTDNAVFDPTDSELATVVGVIPFGLGDYFDFNDNAIADVPAAFSAVLNGTSLYGALVARGTPTYGTTGDLTVVLTIRQD